MTKLSPEETRQCSINALKMVYYVIIGLAITEALNTTFVRDGSFIGIEVFSRKNLPYTVLLLALLPTVTRFVHGASIHLDMISQKRYKPLIDFVGFFIQASAFYLMATSLGKPLMFLILFGVMLFFDALWLIFLVSVKYIDLGRTEKQWLWSDSLIIIAFFILYLVHRTISDHLSLATIVIISIVATFFDYLYNKDFYFPTDERGTSGNTL